MPEVLDGVAKLRVIDGMISGEQIADYRVSGDFAQILSVDLSSSNPSLYLNIMPAPVMPEGGSVGNGTPFDAIGLVPCATNVGQPQRQCIFGVIRAGPRNAGVWVAKPGVPLPHPSLWQELRLV